MDIDKDIYFEYGNIIANTYPLNITMVIQREQKWMFKWFKVSPKLREIDRFPL